jgi:ATP-dependent Clp protease protease subunit
LKSKTEPEIRTVVFHLFGAVGKNGDGGTNGNITLESITHGMRQLLEGDEERRKLFNPVLLINSRGGSVEEALSIYAYLAHLPIEITTVAIGLIESAATYIYLAGKKRLATPHSIFLFHESVTNIRCGTEDLIAQARAERKKHAMEIDIIAQVTGKHEQAARWLRGVHSLTAQEAKAAGIVHEIKEDVLFSGNVTFSDAECEL